VSDAGLTTQVHPAASAGASFHDSSRSGKFQGVIMATTPTGSRSVCTKKPGMPGSVSPVILVAQPA